MSLLRSSSRLPSVAFSFKIIYSADFIVRSNGSRNWNLQLTHWVGRVIGRLYKDQDTKIQEFEDAFQKLRSDLDTGMLQQAIFVTSRILDNTDTIGKGFVLFIISDLTWCCSASGTTEAILDECFISFVMPTGNQSSHYQQNNRLGYLSCVGRCEDYPMATWCSWLWEEHACHDHSQSILWLRTSGCLPLLWEGEE